MNARKKRCHQINMTELVDFPAIIMTVYMSWGTVTANASSRFSAPLSSISLRHIARTGVIPDEPHEQVLIQSS